MNNLFSKRESSSNEDVNAYCFLGCSGCWGACSGSCFGSCSGCTGGCKGTCYGYCARFGQ